MAEAFECCEFPDGALVWYDRNDQVIMRKTAKGLWFYQENLYRFDVWLDLVPLPHEEKVWLRLHFG